MKVVEVTYLTSGVSAAQYPKPDKPEYAFIGRSNVGKSSLINRLVLQPNIARVSATPGKTRTINHFLVDKAWMLADLPGYGYAKLSREQRAKWEIMIKDYLLKRENLMTTFVLVDARLEPQKSDLEFMQFLAENGLPMAIVFTKADKLNQSEAAKNYNLYKKELANLFEPLPLIFKTSSQTGRGRKELWDFIIDVNTQFQCKGR